MKKLVIAAVLFAALGARAEESVTNELEETSAPIVWGFGLPLPVAISIGAAVSLAFAAYALRFGRLKN